jgi:hypothetical protein
VRRVEIDGALLHADEDDTECWVSTLEYDSAPETNLAPPCSPGKPIRLASWRWRMAQETHRTLLSSRQSVSFGDGSRIFFLRKKKTYPETTVNEPRLNEDGKNLLNSRRDIALPEVLFDSDTMLPMCTKLSGQ